MVAPVRMVQHVMESVPWAIIQVQQNEAREKTEKIVMNLKIKYYLELYILFLKAQLMRASDKNLDTDELQLKLMVRHYRTQLHNAGYSKEELEAKMKQLTDIEPIRCPICKKEFDKSVIILISVLINN